MANDNRGRKPNNLNENIDDEIFNLKDQIILDGYSKYYCISIYKYLYNIYNAMYDLTY